MLLTQQKQSQVLRRELVKLQTLIELKLTNNFFWLGYITAYASDSKDKNIWENLMKCIHNSQNAAKQNIITEKNFHELLLTGSKNSIGSKKRRDWDINPGIQIQQVIKFINGHIQQLATDPKYLSRNYFDQMQQKKQQKKVSQIKEVGADSLGLECPICCEQITISTVCPINCGHLLHKSCFTEYFKSRVEVKKFPIICPIEECNQQIPTHDIQQYITGDLLAKYYEFSLHEFVDKNKKNTGWCPTADCKAIYEFEGQLAQYQCPSCKKKYCLKCRTDAHSGLTCEENRQINNLPPEDKQFINFVKQAKFKKCPSCNFWVSKNHGCDHMTCRCGYEFCYRCGAEFGTCGCEQNQSFYNDSDDDQEDSQPDYFEEPPQIEKQQKQQVPEDEEDDDYKRKNSQIEQIKDINYFMKKEDYK